MPAIFLNHRRADTAGEVGRLADSINRSIGATFHDTADIRAGDPFELVLAQRLAASDVVLVFIGPAWEEELNRRSRASAIDYVRMEIAAALTAGKRVIPILIRGAALPARAVLPEDIRPLADRQAMAMRDEAWPQDIERLVTSIGRPYAWGRLAIRCVVAVSAILIASWTLVPMLPIDPAEEIAYARILVAGSVCIYAACESAMAYRRCAAMRRQQQLVQRA